jgi:sugar lactone lactonase YvrE
MTRLLFGVVAAGWLALAPLSAGQAPASQASAGQAPASASSAAASTSNVIPFEDGEPASVTWDAATHALYIADSTHNQVWRWTDTDGLTKFASLADPLNADAAGATLVGQIVRLSDGSLVINRFGKPGGGFGGIAFVNVTTGVSGVVPNLDVNRRRLGLAVASGGRLFGSYFGGGMGAGAGGGGMTSVVTKVDLKTGETDFLAGFKKIVGLLVVDDVLYVSDQMADAIYAVPLNGPAPAPGAQKVFATLPRPDQLAAGPDGSLFTGQFQAAPGSAQSIAVRQVLPDGTVRIVAQDPDVTRPSGVAYDAEGHRLFVANSGNPAHRFVRIIAIK